MRKLFEIDENEKRRILEMHENATKKMYLSEQPTTGAEQPTTGAGQPTTGQETTGVATIDGVTYKLPGIVDKTTLESLIGDATDTDEELAAFNDYFTGQGGKLQFQMNFKPKSGEQTSGLGKRALTVVRKSLDRLAQTQTDKQNVCGQIWVWKDENFKSVNDYSNIVNAISGISARKLSDFIGQMAKRSQYCKSKNI
jgi:hypothetical protein